MPSLRENDDTLLLILEREPNHILDMGEREFVDLNLASPEQLINKAPSWLAAGIQTAGRKQSGLTVLRGSSPLVDVLPSTH